MAQMVKNLLAVQETWVRSLGWEDPLQKGMATHSSILAGRIAWTEEPGGLQSMGSQRVGYTLRTKQQQNITQTVTASVLAMLFHSCASPAPHQSQHQWSRQSFPLSGTTTVISEAPKPRHQPRACRAAVTTHFIYQSSLAL